MRLFCYGSLMLPEIMEKVIGRRLRPPRPAVLQDYRLYSLKQAEYPALLAQNGDQVRGVVYQGLRQADLHRLDTFEGKEYRRQRCSIQRANGDELPAWVYVYRETYRKRLGKEGWSLAEFRRRHLRRYLGQ